MTQEEFGTGLFACIGRVGKILACQDQYAHVVLHGDRDAVDRKARELAELKKSLPARLDTLSTEEAAAVVNRYPWVLSL